MAEQGDWTPEVHALAEQIRTLVAQLVEITTPADDGWSQIITDAVVVAARSEFGPDGVTKTLVSVMPMSEQMPDWHSTGLLDYALRLYWEPHHDE